MLRHSERSKFLAIGALLSVLFFNALGSVFAKVKKITVPAGTRILVRTIDSVNSKTDDVGKRFKASLESNLVVRGVVVAHRGSNVYGRLAYAKSAGRIAGTAELTLELTDIMIRGTAYPIVTDTVRFESKGGGAKTAKRTVGGAALGTIIGAIAGGGKGAAIGAGVGAVAGGATAVLTNGKQVNVPSESLLEFRLHEPVRLPMAVSD
jgi:hypothetical protein